MADGLFYLDTREPHLVSNLTAVTMTTTAKAMYPAAAFPVLGGQYFNRPGKAIKIEDTVTDVRIDTTTSDANGLYEFRYAGQPPTTYYLVAYKAGSPDVAGTTVNTLVGT
jgi:hypothetical protein